MALRHIDYSMLEEKINFWPLFRYAQTGRCVNGVTHDVNNQLGAVMAYTELVILDESLSEKSKDMLERVLKAVEQSALLVSNLTVLARPEKPSRDMVNFSSVVENILRLRRYAMRTQKTVCDWLCGDDAPLLPADAARLHLMLVCLVLNAEEAVTEGGDNDRLIRLRLSGTDAGLCFSIWNSGPVIAPEDRSAVFEPFVTSKEGHHAGFGLGMARQIAREHGGSLEYTPEEGFVLLLPPGGLDAA